MVSVGVPLSSPEVAAGVAPDRVEGTALFTIGALGDLRLLEGGLHERGRDLARGLTCGHGGGQE